LLEAVQVALANVLIKLTTLDDAVVLTPAKVVAAVELSTLAKTHTNVCVFLAGKGTVIDFVVALDTPVPVELIITVHIFPIRKYVTTAVGLDENPVQVVFQICGSPTDCTA
jgi:hypothetical protein